MDFMSEQDKLGVLYFTILHLQELYAGPDDLVEKIKSLSVTSDCSMTGKHCC